MSTSTATKTATAPLEVEVASEKGAVAVFQPPRLPYHPAIKDRFNVEPSAWKALVEAIYPSAKTVDAVIMALSYCKARDLDPFKRPVHIVPMWDNKKKCYVETIWPGISELRTTAFRTGNYAGTDEAEFGPIIKHGFAGRVQVYKDGKKEWADKEIGVQAPEWCRITVYRDLHNRLCKFVGPKVYWLEAYATIGNSELPNEMWQTRAIGQLEKCAEAASLRRAFPEEIGNELTAEEMTGRQILHDDRLDADHVVRRATPETEEGPPSPDAVKGGAEQKPQQQTAATQPAQAQAQPAEAAHEDGEIVVEDAREFEEQLPLDEKPQTATAGADGLTEAERTWLNDVNGAFSSCEDMVSLGVKQKEVMAPMKKSVSAAAWAKAQHFAEDAFRRIQQE